MFTERGESNWVGTKSLILFYVFILSRLDVVYNLIATQGRWTSSNATVTGLRGSVCAHASRLYKRIRTRLWMMHRGLGTLNYAIPGIVCVHSELRYRYASYLTCIGSPKIIATYR